MLAATFLVAVGKGAVEIPLDAMLAILAQAVGLDIGWEAARQHETVLLAIRLPRACLAMLAGAALAISGAALQGLFRNPLADPGLIGVSSGAALAAVTVIVLGAGFVPMLPAFLRLSALPLAAFAGGLATTLLVHRIASRDGRTDVATMLLAGVAVSAIANAGLGMLIFVSDEQQLRDLNFWMLGSLGGVTWAKLLSALPLIAPALALLPLFARHLNALLLGETDALHLGVDVERTKRAIVVLAALATGASVALTGIIGFVGLVVPHLVRMTFGPDHRYLLPISILLGASLMLAADLAARFVVLPAELPIGIVTAAVGGPFFLWLLLRRRALAGW
jgi:iron complex transport system permease protein